MDKLKHRAGETLVEMLCSMLIISLGVLMLTGAVATSARLNYSAEQITKTSSVGESEPVFPLNANVIFKDEDENTRATVQIQVVRDGGNYRYD